jgi:hypothetical protein
MLEEVCAGAEAEVCLDILELNYEVHPSLQQRVSLLALMY